MAGDEVILVNEYDEPIGSMEKMEVHRKALLHRAFSVFIVNAKGDMLLQQRAHKKYHSAGLWTNACCSHPRPGEGTIDAAVRRLSEELGFSASLSKIFDFTYRSEFENGLTEFEFDHVFLGVHDGNIHPDKNEVNDYCFKSPAEIEANLASYPQNYTVWFHHAFPLVQKWINENSPIRKDSGFL
jgi:isopentenyl-diphosphate Delta-isomerase